MRWRAVGRESSLSCCVSNRSFLYRAGTECNVISECDGIEQIEAPKYLKRVSGVKVDLSSGEYSSYATRRPRLPQHRVISSHQRWTNVYKIRKKSFVHFHISISNFLHLSWRSLSCNAYSNENQQNSANQPVQRRLYLISHSERQIFKCITDELKEWYDPKYYIELQ